MYAAILNNQKLLRFLKFFNLPKNRQVIRQIIIYTFIVEIVVALLFATELLFIHTITSTTLVTADIQKGVATEQLIQKLKTIGLDPKIGSKVSRVPFSVVGSAVALHGDNIQVFEYLDPNAALKDATLMAQKYITLKPRDVWNDSVYIYTKGTLVIFYMGRDESIISVLNDVMGDSLIEVVNVLKK